MCKYFLKGECKKAENCEFKHEDNIRVNKYKTKLCKNYQERGVCQYRDQCSFAHGEKELNTNGNGDRFRE